jgi:hypothetical protein
MEHEQLILLFYLLKWPNSMHDFNIHGHFCCKIRGADPFDFFEYPAKIKLIRKPSVHAIFLLFLLPSIIIFLALSILILLKYSLEAV